VDGLNFGSVLFLWILKIYPIGVKHHNNKENGVARQYFKQDNTSLSVFIEAQRILLKKKNVFFFPRRT
jgi:hypothetical protein